MQKEGGATPAAARCEGIQGSLPLPTLPVTLYAVPVTTTIERRLPQVRNRCGSCDCVGLERSYPASSTKREGGQRGGRQGGHRQADTLAPYSPCCPRYARRADPPIERHRRIVNSGTPACGLLGRAAVLVPGELLRDDRIAGVLAVLEP